MYYLEDGINSRLPLYEKFKVGDKLYVYDNEVQKIVCSGSNQTVDYTTESRCLKLYFYSDGSVVYSGIALTLDFIKDE